MFETAKQAMDHLGKLIPSGSTVSYGGSTTLKTIGYLDALKQRKVFPPRSQGPAAGCELTPLRT